MELLKRQEVQYLYRSTILTEHDLQQLSITFLHEIFLSLHLSLPLRPPFTPFTSFPPLFPFPFLQTPAITEAAAILLWR